MLYDVNIGLQDEVLQLRRVHRLNRIKLFDVFLLTSVLYAHLVEVDRNFTPSFFLAGDLKVHSRHDRLVEAKVKCVSELAGVGLATAALAPLAFHSGVHQIDRALEVLASLLLAQLALFILRHRSLR